MKGEAETLVRFMEGSDKRFVIPVYQRNYDWKIENCKQLYDDLKKLIKNGHPSHFFGSIVSVYDYDSDERLIIDGQQRLTTVSLLFLAMYNLLEEQVLVSENIQLSKQIFNKYLVDEYKPEEKQMDIYSLEDETDLTGRNIVKFTLKNNEENVSSWAEMYQKVLQILHQEDKAVLTKLAKSSNRDDLSVHVSFRKEDFPSSVEIADGIHALTKTSTTSKLALLRRFFALYRLEESDLIFYLENKAETEDNEEPEGSREIYKRYWTQTLEALHSVHGENCFYYVKSSEKPKSWIRGAVGHQGITIRCVANQNMAKVQFYIGSSNKDNNKKIYDYLYSKKDEIESKLEKKLNWDRDDDDKSSKIYVENSDLGIANENVWGKMTEYHVQWSKKFYDVFVPYLNKYMEK